MMQLQSIFLSYLTPPKLPWFGTSGQYFSLLLVQFRNFFDPAFFFAHLWPHRRLLSPMRVRRLRGRGRGHRGGGVGGSLKYLILCLVFLSYEWDLPLVPFCWNRYFLLLFFLSPWLGSQPPHSPGPPGDSPCCHLRTSSFKGKMFIPSCFCSIKTNLLANLSYSNP